MPDAAVEHGICGDVITLNCNAVAGLSDLWVGLMKICVCRSIMLQTGCPLIGRRTGTDADGAKEERN